MSREIARISKRDGDAFWRFRERQKNKFNAIRPALQKSFLGWSDLLSLRHVGAVPYLNTSTIYDELRNYFEDERVRLAFTFQAKYLGMSPFECPSLFTILPHIEHQMGVWHPIGGCNQISVAMARLFEELGGRVHLRCPVSRCLVGEDRVVRGFELASGERLNFDYCVMNSDFAHGISELFSESERRRYKNSKLEKLKYSCSTFMMYLGVEGEFPEWGHHRIYFAQNYRRNVREITQSFELSEDPSFYVQNASVTDPSLAPRGQSALYILVPVPNLFAKIDWAQEKMRYRDKILSILRERTGVDLAPRIREERIVTPQDWQNEFRVYKGATFSLAHSWDQMLQFRPHNESDEFKNFYLVGGGTHPGSGLPTILESARIAARLIAKRASKKRSTRGVESFLEVLN
jgi:phytoene desaturase